MERSEASRAYRQVWEAAGQNCRKTCLVVIWFLAWLIQLDLSMDDRPRGSGATVSLGGQQQHQQNLLQTTADVPAAAGTSSAMDANLPPEENKNKQEVSDLRDFWGSVK